MSACVWCTCAHVCACTHVRSESILVCGGVVNVCACTCVMCACTCVMCAHVFVCTCVCMYMHVACVVRSGGEITVYKVW